MTISSTVGGTVCTPTCHNDRHATWPSISASLETYTRVSNPIALYWNIWMQVNEVPIVPSQLTSFMQLAWDQGVLLAGDTHCDPMRTNLHLIYVC